MKKPQEKGSVSRRQFLTYTIGAIAGVITAAVSIPLAGYFISPALKKKDEDFVAIAPANAIPQGVPIFVEYEERTKDGWIVQGRRKGAWVLTKDGKNFTVYDPRCTHLGCAYSWNQDQKLFLCPCHVGVFDIDGKVVSGPPPRPLDQMETKIGENGEIMVGPLRRTEG